MANKLGKVISTAYDGPVAPSSYKMSEEEKTRQRRYRAEDALRILTRAEEIRRDKALMGDVRMLVKEQMKTLKEFA